MPGFANGVMYANNVRFDGADGPPQVTLDGQLLIGSTVAPNIRVGTLTAGPGINITNAAGAITITNTSAAAVSFNLIAVNTIGLTNNGYVCNAAANLLISLPAVAAFGDLFIIERNLNAAGQWTITQGAGQQILAGNTASTVGAGGSLASTNFGDVVVLRCIVANTTWSVESAVGNLTAL